MIDDILAIGGNFDWITATVNLIKDIKNGASDFGVAPQITPRHIKTILRGVSVWGFQLSPDGSILMFMVAPGDALYAEQELNRAGVPIITSPIRR